MAEMTPEERQWWRACNALLLEVDASIARDVQAKPVT